MDIIEKYNTIRDRNISLITNNENHLFEVDQYFFIRITKGEALRLEDFYGNIEVAFKPNSSCVILKKRLK